MSGEPRVGVIMGSDSDWPVMQAAADALAEFAGPCEVGVYSAHRTPQRMLDYATSAAERGLQVIVAGKTCEGKRPSLLFPFILINCNFSGLSGYKIVTGWLVKCKPKNVMRYIPYGFDLYNMFFHVWRIFEYQ